MVEHDFGIAHARVLESQGQLIEAANLRLREGEALYAVRLLLHDHQSSAAREQAVVILLDDLWRTLSFAIGPSEHNAQRLETLFDLVDQVGEDTLNPAQKQEVRVSTTYVDFTTR